jgi:hypothetical protein
VREEQRARLSWSVFRKSQHLTVMHETMSPNQPTKTHTACIASPKLPLTHHHLLSLIAQSQGARTRRLPSRTCQERNSLARLGGWAKSAKSGISWVLRRPHPVRLSIPGRADQPFSCNLPATAPHWRHDMPINHAPRRHDLPTLPIRNPRSEIPSPTCVACFTTADVFLNAGATYGAPPRTPSGKLVTVCSALCVILRLFWTFYVLTPPCARCY